MQNAKLTVLLDMRLVVVPGPAKKAKAGSALSATKARLACPKRSRTPGYVIYVGKLQLDVYHVCLDIRRQAQSQRYSTHPRFRGAVPHQYH